MDRTRIRKKPKKTTTQNQNTPLLKALHEGPENVLWLPNEKRKNHDLFRPAHSNRFQGIVQKDTFNAGFDTGHLHNYIVNLETSNNPVMLIGRGCFLPANIDTDMYSSEGYHRRPIRMKDQPPVARIEQEFVLRLTIIGEVDDIDLINQDLYSYLYKNVRDTPLHLYYVKSSNSFVKLVMVYLLLLEAHYDETHKMNAIENYEIPQLVIKLKPPHPFHEVCQNASHYDKTVGEDPENFNWFHNKISNNHDSFRPSTSNRFKFQGFVQEDTSHNGFYYTRHLHNNIVHFETTHRGNSLHRDVYLDPVKMLIGRGCCFPANIGTDMFSFEGYHRRPHRLKDHPPVARIKQEFVLRLTLVGEVDDTPPHLDVKSSNSFVKLVMVYTLLLEGHYDETHKMYALGIYEIPQLMMKRGPQHLFMKTASPNDNMERDKLQNHLELRIDKQHAKTQLPCRCDKKPSGNWFMYVLKIIIIGLLVTGCNGQADEKLKTEGENLTMSCNDYIDEPGFGSCFLKKIEPNVGWIVTWEMDSYKIWRYKNRVEVENSGTTNVTFIIKNLTRSDAGIFQIGDEIAKYQFSLNIISLADEVPELTTTMVTSPPPANATEIGGKRNTTEENQTPTNGNQTVGKIVGGVIACVVAITVFTVAIICFYKRRSRNTEEGELTTTLSEHPDRNEPSSSKRTRHDEEDPRESYPMIDMIDKIEISRSFNNNYHL